MKKITLHGITWAHSRGITPLFACSQRFNEMHPTVEIHWQKRSLQDFADFSLESLAKNFDLLIIDHPWVGTAAATQCLLSLNKYLSKEFLQDQSIHSVGLSHSSYEYNGDLWALAIDAAAPTASYRADLFDLHNRKVPDTWEDLIELAKEGRVAMASIPVDLALHFLMFCIAVGEQPFQTEEKVVSLENGIKALQDMKKLWSLCDKEVFKLNPIALAEKMTTSDKYWYCPFSFCYSNYSRSGYADKTLKYTDLIRFTKYHRLQSVLGGTGLAVSSSTKNRQICLRFAEWICSSVIQRTVYAEHGGQPGHRSAWTNQKLNELTNNFFLAVLPALDRAYIRPRYNGFLHYQDFAGTVLRRYLRDGADETQIIRKLNSLYVESLAIGNAKNHNE